MAARMVHMFSLLRSGAEKTQAPCPWGCRFWVLGFRVDGFGFRL